MLPRDEADPVHKFLLPNMELESLHVDGCFSEPHSAGVEAFCEHVNPHFKLIDLYVAGTEKRFLGESFSLVVCALGENARIRLLYISGNRSLD